MLIPSTRVVRRMWEASLSRRVNANSQLLTGSSMSMIKLIKKGEC